MDNKLRIQRVKEGIKLLEKGHDACFLISGDEPCDQMVEKWLGVNAAGCNILYVNGPSIEAIEYGFKEGGILDTETMLHNWKRFLELIEKIKCSSCCSSKDVHFVSITNCFLCKECNNKLSKSFESAMRIDRSKYPEL